MADTNRLRSGDEGDSPSTAESRGRPISAEAPSDMPTADEAQSSVSSDKSDSKPPRSAMRRSSSNTKLPQSPRRVRFDFMGEEVLPTASPQPSAFAAPRLPSPELKDGPTFYSSLATEPGEEDDDDEYLPVTKVSSSDALRALSKVPLEDGTVWTEVNSGSAEDLASVSPPSASPSASAAARSPTSRKFAVRSRSHSDQNGKIDDPPNESKGTSVAAAAALSARGSIGRSQHMTPDGKTTISQGPRKGSTSGGGYTPRSRDPENMFHFEEDGLGMSTTNDIEPATTVPETPDESDDDEDEHDNFRASSSSTPADSKSNLYATSPAMNIPSPLAGEHDEFTPTRSSFQPGSLGSFRGRPLMMNVLRNTEILDEIAADDEANMAARENKKDPNEEIDFSQFTPKSFSERLMLEEAMERAQKKRAK